MEPESEPECLLGLSAHLLALRDLTSCRKYALQAQKSDPKADQILAVVDVLLAAEHRLHNQHLDYYAILQIRRSDCESRDHIRTQLMKMLNLLSPNKNKFAFSRDAFNLVWDAWTVLSNPEKKTQYDKEAFKTEQNEETTGGSESETFWTLCPYCYCMYEYEKVYEDCCLKCQNCKRAFHGVAVNEPQMGMMVEGKEEQYYCCWGYFPLGYKGKKEESESDGLMNGKDVNNGGSKGNVSSSVVVEISDNSEDENDSVEGNVKSEVGVGVNELSGGNERVVRNVKTTAGRMKNIKTVARNTKKIMGVGMRARKNEFMSGGGGGGGVEFGDGVGEDVNGNGGGMGIASGSGSK